MDSSIKKEVEEKLSIKEIENELRKHGFVFNNLTEYWERENEMVLIEETL